MIYVRGRAAQVAAKSSLVMSSATDRSVLIKIRFGRAGLSTCMFCNVSVIQGEKHKNK